MRQILFLVLISLLAVGCGKEEVSLPFDTTSAPNVLLIIADDVGKDAINGYSEGIIKANTPNLDALRNNGLTFNNMWAYPTCTPTRSSIITGKYGYHTEVKWAGDILDPSEKILQQYISEQTSNSYATAIIGKWHLSGNNNTVNPESLGMDYYAGLIRGTVNDYFNWQFTEDGTSTTQTTYTSEFFTDLSMDWIGEQSKPWFLWLAYNAPHTPFHAPPSNMHSQGNLPAFTTGANPIPYYMAAIEAMDFQIGRLLDSMTEAQRNNTVIIFIGDNGSPVEVAQSPYSASTSKGTLYQGGINVPMFISGNGVSRSGVDENLITSTDLFATISELAGANTAEINDSKSFKSLLSEPSVIRRFQYVELEDGTRDRWAISNGEYKLVVNANGNEQMYDLISDPYESNNVLLGGNLTADEIAAKADLELELSIIRD